MRHTPTEVAISCRCGHADLSHCLPKRLPSCEPVYLINPIHPIYGPVRERHERAEARRFSDQLTARLVLLVSQQQEQGIRWRRQQDGHVHSVTDSRTKRRRYKADDDDRVFWEPDKGSSPPVHFGVGRSAATQANTLDERGQHRPENNGGEARSGFRRKRQRMMAGRNKYDSVQNQVPSRSPVKSTTIAAQAQEVASTALISPPLAPPSRQDHADAANIQSDGRKDNKDATAAWYTMIDYRTLVGPVD